LFKGLLNLHGCQWVHAKLWQCGIWTNGLQTVNTWQENCFIAAEELSLLMKLLISLINSSIYLFMSLLCWTKNT
jgi:hypothetical protein